MALQIPQVEKFLCFSLEGGHRFMGWFGAIWMPIVILLAGIAFGMALADYPGLIKAMQIPDNQKVLLSDHQTLFTVLLALSLLYCIVVFYCYIQLIRGVNRRNAGLLKPYMIIIAIEIVLSLLLVLDFTLSGVFNALIFTVVNGYLFICAHSLWEVFRDEAMRGRNKEYQQAPAQNMV